MTDGAPPVPLTESIVNWLWLANLPQWRRALEIRGGPVSLLPVLEAHFGEVVSVDPPTLHGKQRAAEARYDCIVAHGSVDRDLTAFLRGAHARLEPGGCLAFSYANPLRLHRTAPRVVPSLRFGLTASHEMRRAGFGPICTYYLEPSLERVRYLTPATAALVRHRLGQRHARVRSGLAPLLALPGAGLLVFPAVLHLAYR